MSSPYDIAIAWRIYPGISKRPLIHAEDKFKLVQTSLISFLNSAKGLSISYYFILDGCPADYKALIENLFNGQKFSILETPKIGNLATFKKQVEILTTQKDADIVYFAEDDYLYVPEMFSKAYSFIKTQPNADFVSTYLHADIFSHPIHRHKREVAYFDNKLWLTSCSTCLTFMTTVETLQKTQKVFLTYSKGNNDCALWLVLTKTHIYNPFIYLKYLFTNRECGGILKRAVQYSFLYFFSAKKYKLWSPFPSIGTHLETGLESPGTDWKKISIEISNNN